MIYENEPINSPMREDEGTCWAFAVGPDGVELVVVVVVKSRPKISFTEKSLTIV